MSVYLRKRSRKNNKYCYEIIIDQTNAAGKRIRKTRTLPVGTTKAEAERISKKIELELEFGEYIDREPTSLNDYFVNVYMKKYIYMSDLSPTTVKGYKQIFLVNGGLSELLGDHMINNISVEMIQDYIKSQVKVYGRSAKTIRNHIGLLSGILQRAMIDKYVTKRENPAKYVILPKKEKKPVMAYSLAEVKEIMRRADEDGNINMLALIGICCMGGGLRRSEVCAMKFSNCVLDKESDENYIKIVESIVQVEGGQALRNCKTENSVRTVPIGNTLTNILIRLRKQNKVKKMNAGEDFAGGDYLFLMDKPPFAPMKPNYLYNMYTTFIRERCPNLPQLKLKALRSSYASACANLDFKSSNLTAALGHSDISTTNRYYIKSYSESLRADVQKLEEAYLNTDVKQA